ncbi:MAG: carboxypeptidase-like regulatory domain-containing protein, partial [Blastocatellia bacterium]
MLKPKMTTLVFVFLFSLSFQIAAQSQQKTASAGTATISGRVVLKGEPARNVLVYLRSQRSPAPSNPDAILRARTDESGQFRITGVAAGVYIVVALAPGFTSSDVSQPGFRGKTLNVSEGENVENLDIEIKRGGIITGRVTDSQGRPLVEERVALSRL